MNLVDITELQNEANRALTVCNACRYCEGYCPVFPAITELRKFEQSDLNYVANLCHQCTACYHACQYKPPHEFNINIPLVLSDLRQASYHRYTWPQGLARSYQAHPWLTAATTFILSCLVLLLAATNVTSLGQVETGPGSFYRVIDHTTMVMLAGITCGLGGALLLLSCWRYCRASDITRHMILSLANWRAALKAAATLQHMDGVPDQGCPVEDSASSNARRYFHQATMWGFLLCFAATCSATFYQYGLQRLPPYAWFSLPVVLGSVGGLGLMIGPLGLAYLKQRMHDQVVPETRKGTDYTLLTLLFSVSASGMLLLLLRESVFMPVLLAVHLGIVLAFFLLMPYSKFLHGFYRLATLLRYASEQKQVPK